MPVGNPFQATSGTTTSGFKPMGRFGGGSGTLFRTPGGGSVAVPRGNALQASGGFAPVGQENQGGGFVGDVVASRGSESGFNPLLNFADRNNQGFNIPDFRRKLMQQQQM